MTTATYMIGDELSREVERLLATKGHYSLEPVLLEAALFEAQCARWSARETAQRYMSLWRDHERSESHNRCMGYD